MPVELTREQKTALATNGDRFVVASPGSGKTRVALAKVLEQAAIGTERGTSVLAMTFAVNAKGELGGRIGFHAGTSLKRHIVAMTIHGFALHYVVGPHGELFCGRHLELAQPSGSAFREALDDTALVFGSDREQVRKKMDYVRRTANGEPARASLLKGRDSDIALHFWNYLLQNGYVDYANALYVATMLLRSHEWIRNGLAAEFSTIVIDEYQDCTDIQLSILRELKAAGSRLFMVGDPFQCVFGFNGANTDALDAFVTEVGADRLELGGTHRCPPAVLEIAERLFARRMTSVGEAILRPGYVTFDNTTSSIAVLSDFIQRCDEDGIDRSKIAFVRPSNLKIQEMVSELSQFGIPAALVNARVDEEDWFATTVDAFLVATFAKDIADVDALVQVFENLIGRLTSRRNLSISSRDLCRDATELILFGSPPLSKGDLRAQLSEIVSRLCRVLEEAKILMQVDMASIRARLEVEARRFQKDPRAGCSVQDRLSDITLDGKVGGYTYQGIKGLEFEAVAILDIEKGLMPDNRSRGVDVYDDLRKLYVAVTRSCNKLLLHVPNRSSKFLPVLAGQTTAREVIGCEPPVALRTGGSQPS